MKQKFIDFLVSPKSGKKLKVKNPKVENSEIKSGTLLGDDDEYLIEEYIPRFVDNKIINQTQVSFGHKWQKYAQTALGKQEKNKKWFLEQYGWNENDFKNFISSRNKILDIGCGIGYISNWVASESNADVFGVDISRSVDEAHKLFNPYKKNNLQFIQADISQLPFEKEFFDLIICKEMIHHTPDPRKNFSKLSKKIKEKIVDLGTASEQIKKNAFAACDVFALPSKSESFGIVYVEAWSFQKPVIGCNIESTSEVIDDKKNGLLVNFGDIKKLSEAIKFLLENPSIRKEYGIEGKKKAMYYTSKDNLKSFEEKCIAVVESFKSGVIN